MNLFVKALLFLSGISFFAYVAFLLSLEDKSAEATVAAGAGSLLLIFAFLSSFKKFKVLGVEGELWEDKQKEAEKLIAQLKAISPSLAAVSYTSLAGIGRFSEAVPSDEKFKLAVELTTKLQEIGVDTSDIEIARKHFDRLFLYDMASPIWKSYHDILRAEQEAANAAQNAIARPIDPNNEDYNLAIERSRKIATAIQEFREIRERSLNDNADVLERIEKFATESEYVTDAQKKATEAEHSILIRNIRSYIATRNITDPNVVFEEG